MSRHPNLATVNLPTTQAIVERDDFLAESLPEVEHIGAIALFHTAESRRIEFASGAVGHTAAQVHIEGDLTGASVGRISVQLPAKVGNLLLVPREALLDTRIELSRYSQQRIPLDGRNVVQGIMQFLQGREVRGGVYNACISYARSQTDRSEEIVYSLPGADQELVKLHIAGTY